MNIITEIMALVDEYADARVDDYADHQPPAAPPHEKFEFNEQEVRNTRKAIVTALISALRTPAPADEDRLFQEWRDTFPEKHWSKTDLGACRLGWDAGRAVRR